MPDLNEIQKEADERLAWLRAHGYRLTVWQRDDLLEEATQRKDEGEFREELLPTVLDEAWESSELDRLEDSSEQDWNRISWAIADAIERIKERES